MSFTSYPRVSLPCELVYPLCSIRGQFSSILHIHNHEYRQERMSVLLASKQRSKRSIRDEQLNPSQTEPAANAHSSISHCPQSLPPAAKCSSSNHIVHIIPGHFKQGLTTRAPSLELPAPLQHFHHGHLSGCRVLREQFPRVLDRGLYCSRGVGPGSAGGAQSCKTSSVLPERRRRR